MPEPPARPIPPGLHLVSTPIGNLRDITLRALDTLRGADLIACEDTRVTRTLLTAHGIAGRLAAYHDHNAAEAGPALIARLEAGEAVALVSDAGTPLISDPGFRLVGEATARGIPVTVLPGPSAPLAALVLSGQPTDRFHFAGFAPPRPAARRAFLRSLAGIDATLVLLESPRRLRAALADMNAVLGPRPAAVARELTKLYEEVVQGDLEFLAAKYAGEGPPRGEIVVVIGPPGDREPAGDAEIDARLGEALTAMSVRDAAALVAEATDAPRRRVYRRALALARRP
ncbi:MAG: 16S rRNA (cytidine(1402)-2'-O)-methyltransferase [Defluviicoccus sp.]|nr:16S rRNA (cytidine(1402)-2'-O)-methyltransferase [Defluviicoccus sp.]MDE0382560.1 16S rRNA (cytidine(1402)-2'-O)-methyltransferase [Defluviicoccus sp.]